MVPWDRDRIPLLDDSRIGSYWKEHEDLVKAGVDGWWPDEGDWFDLHERFKRHQLYHDGPLSTQPDRRPWSLHRNGHLGVARWGGWVWSGDTQSTWKSLEAQIAVGINHSLSLSPYWGSDIGGFFSTPELTGELYARWFQFAAFCPSFRAHGRTWWTRLPWGWGLDSLGPVEDKEPPLLSELKNPAIEPIARKYAELRYQLLTYNYTLAWQARETGLPFMRALWLHYPGDAKARGIGNEYLWGRDLLVAPVFEKGATSREIYLPEGQWHDFWSGEVHQGSRSIHRPVDLATMPLFARAGAILPLDPVRQYTSEEVKEPLTIRIYRGANGSTQLYHDDGSNAYLKGECAVTSLKWNDQAGKLTIEPILSAEHQQKMPQKLRIEFIPKGGEKLVNYAGEPVTVGFE
jgi:alpha-glucosidase/alpha-D-xyloside xylohydrolase